MPGAWIAVDWGTTALRVSLMEGDRVVNERAASKGMGGLARHEFEPALLALIEDWLDETSAPMPVRCCGMVGARQGWVEAPYRSLPCPPIGDAPIIVPGTDRRMVVTINPGLKQTDPHADVMRGEETQIAGILATLEAFDGCLCLPGTHTKWVHVSAGEVVSFLTVMSGELFSLISKQSVLRHSLGGEDWDDNAFDEALTDALSRPERLTARLFQLRAEDLLHDAAPGAARAALSGLLLGTELAAAKRWWLGREVVITGSDKTTPVYDRALQAQGISTRTLPADAMTRAGLQP